MPVVTTPRGVRVDPREYKKLHLDGGDDCFLDIPSQAVIRSGELNRFLARAEEEVENGSLRFQLVTDGSEVLSRSKGLSDKREIPFREIEALEAAITTFREKAKTEPDLPPKTIRLIERLMLPDPDSAPELYRVYGPAWNRRLGVVWGCEKSSGSSVAPEVAIERLRRRGQPGWLFIMEQALWLLLLCLPFALAAVLFLYFRPTFEKSQAKVDQKEEQPDTSVARAQAEIPEQVLTTETVTRQYLRVRLERSSGLPNRIEAWAELPGRLSVTAQPSVLADQSEHHWFDVKDGGNVRVEWQPQPVSEGVNGEFVDLVFRNDGSVVLPRALRPKDQSRTSPSLVPSAGSVGESGAAVSPKDTPSFTPNNNTPESVSQPNSASGNDKPNEDGDSKKETPLDQSSSPTKPDTLSETSPPQPNASQPTKTPKASPIVQEGDLAIELLRVMGDTVTLIATIKGAPQTPLEDVIWVVDDITHNGNPVKVDAKLERIRIKVSGTSGEKKYGATGTLKRSFVLDDNK